MPAAPAPPTPNAAARPLDAQALERVRARLAGSAQAPWLHAEAARRMAARLSLIRRTPATVLEWGGHLGGGAAELRAAYPQAQWLPVEWPEVLARQGPHGAARQGWRGWFGRRRPPRPLPPGQLAPGSADLVWSSMGLHGVADPPALMRAWHDALAHDGFLMFCTLGPGSLPELRELYAQCGWGPPAAALVDMHDLGDMLVAAGLADPVMDQEQLTLTWADAPSALGELRSLGGNVHPLRHPGLRTPRWLARLREALQARARLRPDGRVALSFELVYGHAFKVERGPRLGPEATLSAEQLQRLARRTRREVP